MIEQQSHGASRPKQEEEDKRTCRSLHFDDEVEINTTEHAPRTANLLRECTEREDARERKRG